ncbi:hypothetical protein [Corallococcus sp. 4LFB]|uniref:hypothetical protein n=1 Tax=Corallococcus sp. 4LFB TaxID=3383249 RepID=UPI00397563EB
MSATDTEKLEAIRARHAAASRGPWRWFGYLRTREVSLEGSRDTVMDFTRWGMSGAQPRWSVKGLLEKLADLVVPDTTPERGRVTDINHPDARFMAASWQDTKDLLGMVDALQARVTHLEGLIQDECERHRQNLLERDAARAFALDFATTAEAAVANHRGPKTGMRAPYHGDFANLMPSIASDLGKWARAARACLAFRPGDTIAPASERAEWSTAEAPTTTTEGSR